MSIANFIGSSIGNGAAYAVHGAARAAVGTGRFGADVVAATTDSYAAKSEELAQRRLALAAARTTPRFALPEAAVGVKTVATRKRATAAA